MSFSCVTVSVMQPAYCSTRTVLIPDVKESTVSTLNTVLHNLTFDTRCVGFPHTTQFCDTGRAELATSKCLFGVRMILGRLLLRNKGLERRSENNVEATLFCSEAFTCMRASVRAFQEEGVTQSPETNPWRG